MADAPANDIVVKARQMTNAVYKAAHGSIADDLAIMIDHLINEIERLRRAPSAAEVRAKALEEAAQVADIASTRDPYLCRAIADAIRALAQQEPKP